MTAKILPIELTRLGGPVKGRKGNIFLEPLEVRQKFVAADDEKRYGFLLHFLAALCAKEAPDVKVRIFGEGRE